MTMTARTLLHVPALLLMAWIVCIHPALGEDGSGKKPAAGAPGETRAQTPPAPLPAIQYDVSTLPEPVQRMREKLLAAARSGDVERLKPIIAANKVPLGFTFGGESDAIAFWKSLSHDGAGREILADLIHVLEAGFVHVAAGTDKALYVWPYHFVYPLEKLTPAQEVELYMLIPAEYRDAMEAIGGYTGFRVGIAPDGTWHFFVAGD